MFMPLRKYPAAQFKTGRRTTPIVLALLLMFTISCSDTQDRDTIRVMSYNIAAGYGDLNTIADVIREHDPDIVALQEVDFHWGERSEFEHQLSELAESLDMYPFSGEIYTLQPDRSSMPARRYGLAWLSRYPYIWAENHPIHRLSTQHVDTAPVYFPGFPEAGILFQGRPLHLFNTHLDYRSDPSVRERQIEDMLQIIEARRQPSILLGDLNARPDSRELEPLFERFEDAWTEAQGPGYTFPSSSPDRRIDYILYDRELDVVSVFVPLTQASDHLPVIADLRWR